MRASCQNPRPHTVTQRRRTLCTNYCGPHKQAFEIIKQLQDKKFIELDKVSDFIEAMDTLIKILKNLDPSC